MHSDGASASNTFTSSRSRFSINSCSSSVSRVRNRRLYRSTLLRCARNLAKFFSIIIVLSGGRSLFFASGQQPSRHLSLTVEQRSPRRCGRPGNGHRAVHTRRQVVLSGQIEQTPPGERIGMFGDLTYPPGSLPLKILVHARAPHSFPATAVIFGALGDFPH